MQVHPHFLYNTLFAIKGLCDMGLNEDASRMIMALANFFRIGLSHGQEIIPVSQEIDHARNYLYIQEMRYGDVFRYSIDVPSELGTYSIIKLTLQPLVENAIYHGVKEKRGQGKIAIRGWIEDGMLHFTVEDDGMGMTAERLAELRRGLAETRRGTSHVGFGVFSVFERLRLHYGEAAGLEITSEPGKGTCIHVVLPAHKLEESEHAYQEMVAAFDTGTAAMMQHNLGSYGSHKHALQPEQFAPLLLPRSRKGTIVQEANNVGGYSIFRTTKHPDAAWRFVRFLCSAEVQSWWNERIGQIPVSRQALESDAMRFYVPPMYLPEYRQIVDGSDRYLEQVLMGKLTVQEFLDQWAARFEKAERDYRRQQRETGR